MLIAFGNGIKSCVSPLGGDQFEPSDQVRYLIDWKYRPIRAFESFSNIF